METVSRYCPVACLLIVLGLAPAALAQAQDTGYGRPIQPAAAWQRQPDSLLHGFRNMYQPCVVELAGEPYPYRMWFFGWAVDDTNPSHPGCDAIYHARSRDLTHWEVYAGDGAWDTTMDPTRWAPVLAASTRFYDAWHNGDPSVVFHDGTYYMAYSATSKPFTEPVKGHPNKMLLCIMGALSIDGIHWTKTAQPLLIEPPEVQNPASDDGWTGDYHRPSLMRDQGKWRLWFDYWHPTLGLGMGHAENSGPFAAEEGFRITHDLARPLIPNWPNPEVVRVRGRYHAFADPNGYPPKMDDSNAAWTSRALCEAVSDDGLTWDIVGFIEPDPDAAACHVPQALVTERDGASWLYMFYATQRGLKDRTDGVYDYRYDRIRAMRRKLYEPKSR